MTVLALFLGLVVLSTLSLAGQVKGPFGITEQLKNFRFPQHAVADCNLPLPSASRSALTTRTYTVGTMTVRLDNRIHVRGKDMHERLWAIDMDIRQGGCWLWQADLDRNGNADLIVVTSDASSDGDSMAALLMIDIIRSLSSGPMRTPSTAISRLSNQSGRFGLRSSGPEDWL
jgi:hypothetical protein